MNESDREQRRAAASFDLLEHPGWQDFIADVVREGKAARTVFFREVESAEKQGLAVERARGTLAVLKNIVLDVYRRANKQPPPQVTALFE